MHVDVIRTIASRLFRIFGSGTSSTLTLYGAHQTSAFIFKFPYKAVSEFAKMWIHSKLAVAGFARIRNHPRPDFCKSGYTLPPIPSERLNVPAHVPCG